MRRSIKSWFSQELGRESRGECVRVAAASIGRRSTFLMCCLFLFSAWSTCLAREVVLIHGPRPQAEVEVIRRLSDFYGLKLNVVEVGSKVAVDRALSQLRSADTLAVLASQDAFSGLDPKKIQAALRRPNGSGIPLLLFGVAPGQGANDLRFWSGGAVLECAPLVNGFTAKAVEITNAAALTRTLAGIELPAVASPRCDLRLEPGLAAQTVIAARGEGTARVPLLVRVPDHTAERFFVPEVEPFDQTWTTDPGGMPKAFSSMAPFILFLSHVAGDYAWHSDGHYANLTIDDAWLTQPYGHLDYPALLPEMERHNFHTTIAFIPWNFDRSKPGVVDLFRNHPERFSICIHGNDHQHREFGDYALNSLEGQIADIKQGVARMERFHTLTGVSYDRFMVFPQGVAPQQTFGALATYDFLGTANAQNVPLGTSFPSDPTFLLRPYTVAYANLLSFSRYTVGTESPRLEIAIQSFLGNPLLFYGHEGVFETGIGAFDESADLVNQAQPDTKWASLGEIARHSHLVRRRDDGGFDVWMLSNEMDLKNPTDADAVFYVKRTAEPKGRFSLAIDGAPASFDQSGNMVALRLVIPARHTSKVRIEYANDLDLAHQDIRKRDAQAYALRWVSDFRDLYVSRSSVGRAITQAYYRNGWDSIERSLERRWWIGVLGIGAVVAGFRYRRRRARKRIALAAAAR